VENDSQNPQIALSDLSAQLDRELADTIFRFEDIQADLNYKQAQTALRELVDQLDLSPPERDGLEAELHSLDFMLDKLDRQVVQIAVFGMVGRGKSSLLNALLGQPIFETGAIHGVTINVQSANWEMTQEAIAGSQQKLTRLSLQGSGNSQIELIDTPGIDEVDGESRERMARQLAKQADLILFVVAGDITKVEFEALSELRKASKPMLLVFNKIDQYPQADLSQNSRRSRQRTAFSGGNCDGGGVTPRRSCCPPIGWSAHSAAYACRAAG
jgi:hypothetical protein